MMYKEIKTKQSFKPCFVGQLNPGFKRLTEHRIYYIALCFLSAITFTHSAN